MAHITLTRCYSVAHDVTFVVSGLPTRHVVIACHTITVAMSKVTSKACGAVKVLESTKQGKVKKGATLSTHEA
jgi:hypothetical protein